MMDNAGNARLEQMQYDTNRNYSRRGNLEEKEFQLLDFKAGKKVNSINV